MNGVRRFLAGSVSPAPSSPSSATFPSKSGGGWLPQATTNGTNHYPDSDSLDSPPPTIVSAAPVGLRKHRQNESNSVFNDVSHSRDSSGSSSFSALHNLPQYKSVNGNGRPVAGPSSPPKHTVFSPLTPNGQRRANQTPPITRDDLLVSLLTSEAVVDSREFEILSSEEIEDLKREQASLTTKSAIMTKKLGLETKMRDANRSLARVTAGKKPVPKSLDDPLEAANRRVDTAQQEVWRVTERLHTVQRRLLEHRAGVLGLSVRTLEKRLGGDDTTDTGHGSGYTTPDRSSEMSPTRSSMTSASNGSKTATKNRFDGPHLFAGHADTITPRSARGPVSSIEMTQLEEHLKRAMAELDFSKTQQADMKLQMDELQREKADRQIASAAENARWLRQQEEWEHARDEWSNEKANLEDDKLEEIAQLHLEIESLREATHDEASHSNSTLEQERSNFDRERQQWAQEREEWAHTRSMLEDEKHEEISRFQMEMQTLRAQDSLALSRAKEELENAANGLRAHGIGTPDATLSGLVAAVGIALKSGNRSRSTDPNWESERKRLLEENAAAKREVLVLESFLKGQEQASPIMAYSGDATRLTQVLQPIWAMLPSPEARANRLGSSARRAGPGSTPSTPNTSFGPISSLADLDIRSLKALYDLRHSPSTPMTPSNGSTTLFSVEAFADRVRALLADDRALVERLLRFAHAHDLLKKNAERAQKLASDSGLGLETYQKQVRTLEETIAAMSSRQRVLDQEVRELNSTIERLLEEKNSTDSQVSSHTNTIRQLQDTNNTLSARTLHLAQEASAVSQTKKQLETAEAALISLQKEMDQIRNAESSQQSALMDELNLLQTDNQNLRAQLRAKK